MMGKHTQMLDQVVHNEFGFVTVHVCHNALYVLPSLSTDGIELAGKGHVFTISFLLRFT